MGRLGNWVATQESWVADALRRAALADTATSADAEAIALRVQAAQGIALDETLQCFEFDEACLVPIGEATEQPLLCSIGPLDHVDRLAPGQELKFALNGLTIVFGENGSGKSGYARAARRLCASRIAIKLQSDVFAESEVAPTVTFTIKSGEAEPVPHQWTEGADPPLACARMSFLDTASARFYVEDRAEILFLPPEVRCLTILGQLYDLAAGRRQAIADQLFAAHGGAVGIPVTPTTTAGGLVALLTIATPLARLPKAEALRAAAIWDENAAAQLAEVRLRIAEGPAAQARILRRLGEAAKLIAERGVSASMLLSRLQLERDEELIAALARARGAAAAFAAEQEGRFPIAATGSETWRQLFLIARQFAAEADIVPGDGAFAVGDPCMLCQRPLDEDARDRMAAFDDYIANATAAAVELAKSDINTRIAALRALEIDTESHIMQALAEHRTRDEQLRVLVDEAALASGALLGHRQRLIARLEGGPSVDNLPNVTSLYELFRMANELVARAATLEKDGIADPALVALEMELCDRELLAGSIDIMIARREGLANHRRYLACVAALGTRPISRLAS